MRSDTGIIALRVMMIMMATGPVKTEKTTDTGTTLKDLALMESGKTTLVCQMAHGPQMLLILLSDTS